MPESINAGNFLQILDRAGDLYSELKKEKYVRPTPKQLRNSLIAFRNALDDNADKMVLISMKLSKWYERMAGGSIEEKVRLANELYTIASNRNADLGKEAPEIVRRIRDEYNPRGKHYEGGIRVPQIQAPLDLLRDSINQKLQKLEKLAQ